MQKKLTMGIMAAFVAATLTGCEETTPVYNVTSIDECVSHTGDYLQCSNDWKAAQALNEEVAPRFTDMAFCEDSFGDQCQQKTVTNSDGSTSNVFVPMMAGMMIGNMMANNNLAAQGQAVHQTRTQPLYQEKERRGGGYVPINTLSTSTGSAVQKGSASVSPKMASTVSKFSAPVSRGGFGMSARGGSASS